MYLINTNKGTDVEFECDDFIAARHIVNLLVTRDINIVKAMLIFTIMFRYDPSLSMDHDETLANPDRTPADDLHDMIVEATVTRADIISRINHACAKKCGYCPAVAESSDDMNDTYLIRLEAKIDKFRKYFKSRAAAHASN
jgi:hypothetical protein